VSFVDLFGVSDEGPEPPPAEPEQVRPAWIGPPPGELGVAVPLGTVIAQSENGVVALSHALAHLTGLSFALVAHVGGLRRGQASMLFHEQHSGPQDAHDLPDGLLRLGVELPDGRRV
jgi:hypothetical protein